MKHQGEPARDLQVIDGDGHVREDGRLFGKLVPEEYRGYEPQRTLRDGYLSWRIGKAESPRRRALPRVLEGQPALRGGGDPQARLADMELEGISHAVLFPTVGLFFNAVSDEAPAVALSRAYNDWLGEFTAACPERLVHVAHVPLCAPRRAVEELTRAVERFRSKAVVISSSPVPAPAGPRFLGDPAHEPFWTAAEELGVTVCVHQAATGVAPTTGLDRFSGDYLLYHLCLHPMEMMLAIAEVIGTGVLDRHPRLRVGFMEAGCGWLPSWLDRFDEHAEEWEPDRFPRLPSAQFRAQCFVGTEGGEEGLAEASAAYPENIVFASDYPHIDCTFPGAPGRVWDEEHLDQSQKRAVLRDNAACWFQIAAGQAG